MIGISALRKAGPGGIVVCMAPDVCKTQVGPATVPIPYMIVSMLTMADRTEPTVQFTSLEAFTMNSRLTQCVGDEPGMLGGVVSGVNRGYCRPTTNLPTVQIGGYPMVQTIDMFAMNSAGPEGTPNTVGKAVYLDV